MKIEKMTKKSIVSMIVGVAAFLLSIVGSTYAYLNSSATLSISNTNLTLQVPAKKCAFVASQNTSLGSCNIYSRSSSYTASSIDPYIQANELAPRDSNGNLITDGMYELAEENQVARVTCAYITTVTGNCTCTYNIKLYSKGSGIPHSIYIGYDIYGFNTSGTMKSSQSQLFSYSTSGQTMLSEELSSSDNYRRYMITLTAFNKPNEATASANEIKYSYYIKADNVNCTPN